MSDRNANACYVFPKHLLHFLLQSVLSIRSTIPHYFGQAFLTAFLWMYFEYAAPDVKKMWLGGSVKARSDAWATQRTIISKAKSKMSANRVKEKNLLVIFKHQRAWDVAFFPLYYVCFSNLILIWPLLWVVYFAIGKFCISWFGWFGLG